MVNNKCECFGCNTHSKYKWSIVMECPCGCHTSDGLTAHDSLCCEVPNALKKNNPHNELESSKIYLNKLNEYYEGE